MARVPVEFWYYTGLAREVFKGATLTGSWTPQGEYSPQAWSDVPMTPLIAEDGCMAFHAQVELDDSPRDQQFRWGVRLLRADGTRIWGIFAEIKERHSSEQQRILTLRAPADRAGQREEYHLARYRQLGSQRWYPERNLAAEPAIRFAVWAPHARQVEVVFGGPGGYIADDGSGQDATLEPLPMQRGADGVWWVVRPGFQEFVGRRYMYRLTTDDGRVVYRTDMYSREQAGRGNFDPGGRPYEGTATGLDGTPSCTLVVDPDRVPAFPANGTSQTAREFWADEFTDKPIPRRPEDLVIYELHVGALGFGQLRSGSLADALRLVPYLAELGITAVELLPLAEFNETRSWGYGTSHFLAIEASAGGQTALKHFVKACHQRGIAVLMDVVYNHYNPDSVRAAWQFDSASHERNSYYWYEGAESDYPGFPEGGYVDNLSTGYAPRYHEELVRAVFIDSALQLVEDCHVDGLRLDQTTSIHLYNALHLDGRSVPNANVFGLKFLREFCRTLKAVRSDVFLSAEDHSNWSAITQDPAEGGVGFDAGWHVDFYHHLIGDKGEGPEYAKLLYQAGVDSDGPLAMGYFAGALEATSLDKIVYHENHDEAGNAAMSSRTILVAVQGAPLVGETRRFAEARCRVVAGLSLLSAGIPLFLMGEEVGATKKYTYDQFYCNKEDLLGLRQGLGQYLFAYYRDLIALRRSASAIRHGGLQVIHARDQERVIAFRRFTGEEEYLVVASLNVRPFHAPHYSLHHGSLADHVWREVLNSDSGRYRNGDTNRNHDRDAANRDLVRHAAQGQLDLVLPACSIQVLRRES